MFSTKLWPTRAIQIPGQVRRYPFRVGTKGNPPRKRAMLRA
jgi:hypothetical protein